MPQIKIQPMTYLLRLGILRTDIFSLFSPSQYMAKKERKNIIHLSKNFYRTISFLAIFIEKI